MLEKPPCATVEQARTLCELASDSDATLYCGWHSQFAPAVYPAIEWLRQRRVRYVRIDWREDVRVWHPGQQWIWEAEGFGVFDAGINALSIATKSLSEPMAVESALLRIPERCAAPVSAELALSGRSGMQVTASFDFLQTGPSIWEIEIETDAGLLKILDGGSRLLLDGEESILGQNREYAALYSRFAELVDSGQSETDLAPLILVIDAFERGRREIVPPLDLLFSKPMSPDRTT
jgi:D-galactose 1-dehydrogenase